MEHYDLENTKRYFKISSPPENEAIKHDMATNLPFCFSIQFLGQLLKFLGNFTLLKYVKSQRSYGFLITKELIFGFQILDLKDHFSASLNLLNHRVTTKKCTPV